MSPLFSHDTSDPCPEPDDASVISRSSSVFSKVPDSPNSWRDSSFSGDKPKTAVFAKLRECTIDSKTQTHISEPLLRPEAKKASLQATCVPPLPTFKKEATGIESSESNPCEHQKRHARAHASILHKNTASTRKPAPLRAPSDANRRRSHYETHPTNQLMARDHQCLKIKVVCPNTDDILALKIRKEKLRCMSELIEAVSFKLNIRYCVEPEKITYYLLFPGSSLQKVKLEASSDLYSFEDLAMDYIKMKSRIYLEAKFG